MPQIQPATFLNFDELLRAKTHKARSNGAFIHIFNTTTGVTEFILRKNSTGVATQMVERTIDGHSVLVEEAIEMLPTAVKLSVPYSGVLLDLICEKVVEGLSLKKICEMPGMPSYATLSHWRRNIAEVDERLAQAREDRGEYLRDLAMEAIEGMDEDNVASSTARHKAMVWAAGVDNSRYSPKAKIDATISNPTQILVYTGIGEPQNGQTHRQAAGDQQVHITDTIRDAESKPSDDSGSEQNTSD